LGLRSDIPRDDGRSTILKGSLGVKPGT
jgi:hypothetical protein